MANTTEDTVRDVLGFTYDKFGFQNDTRLIDRIIDVLNNPFYAVTDDGSAASEAADLIREMLWSRYTGGGVSAVSTCNLFHILGRENELGWISDEGHYTESDAEYFQECLVRARNI